MRRLRRRPLHNLRLRVARNLDEGLFKVGNQVGIGLKADVEAHDAMIVCGSARHAADVVGHSETGDTAPTVAHAKQFEGIDESVDLLLRGAGLENKGKDAGRAEKIAFPELMAGAGFESGMKHAFNLRARSKPLGDGEGGSFDGRETHGKSLEPAKREAAVVGGDSAADDLLGVAEAPVERIVTDG